MTKPRLQQTVSGSRPYRLYTVDHVPFGHFPTYAEGGPATVAHAGWSASSSTAYSDVAMSKPLDGGQVTVHVTRNPCRMGQAYDASLTERHAIDGQTFATKEEADKAKYDAGVIAYMVYEPGSGFGTPEANDALVAAEYAREVTA